MNSFVIPADLHGDAMKKLPWDPMRGFYVGAGVFEDPEGCSWVFNPQRGWLRLPGNSRSNVAARIVRVLLRHRRDPRAMRVAERMGVYAVHALHLGYQ